MVWLRRFFDPVPRTASALWRLTVIVAAVFACGCDTPPPAPTSQPAPKSYRVQVELLATLLPRQPTHLTVAGDGTTYFVQEKPAGEDVMFAIPPGGIAQATTLTVQAIASALGKRDGVSGKIQSIAVDPTGVIYFFFAGGTRRTNLSCLGMFSRDDGNIRILADDPALSKATLMGDSFNLARGTVAIGGSNLWLLCQNPAMAAAFRIPLSSITDAELKPIPAFTSLHTPFGQADLARDEVTIAAHPNGNLFVTDRYTGSLWEVDSIGEAKLALNLVGATPSLATAGVNRAGDFATLLNGVGQILPRMEGHADPTDLLPNMPVLLLHRGNDALQMGKDAFQSAGEFSVTTMGLDQLVADVEPDRWIGYDRNSGELIRLRLIPVR